jgi:hypothetical protein
LCNFAAKKTISLPEFPFGIGVQPLQNFRQPQAGAMELPCPVPMILSIKLPRALLQVVLEQSDIDNSAIGVDVP